MKLTERICVHSGTSSVTRGVHPGKPVGDCHNRVLIQLTVVQAGQNTERDETRERPKPFVRSNASRDVH